MQKKSFDNLFIHNKRDIVNSIDKWLNMHEFYNKLNIIYKYGILLYGEPGTGNSTFVLALANYLNYDILPITADILEKKISNC